MANKDNDGETALSNLLLEELQDMYHAETQQIKALPKMAKAAHDPTLKEGFQMHLEQTKGHVERLEKAFELLGEKIRKKTCWGMKGIIEEGTERISEGKKKTDVEADLATISAAERAEHYEIAGYWMVTTLAENLNRSDIAALLQQNMQEEEETAEKLNGIAQPMLRDMSGRPISDHQWG